MFSARSNEITPFVVMQLLQRAREYESQGKAVMHFEVGEPDFQTAEPILRRLKAQFQRDTLSTHRLKVFPNCENASVVTISPWALP